MFFNTLVSLICYRRYLMPLLVLIFIIPAESMAEKQKQPSSEVGFYIRTYGLMLESDSRVKIAQKVFKRVRASADKDRRRPPKIVFIDRQPKRSIAFALNSGHIVISKKALDICHKQADKKTIETRLAFIIGHELAHLAKDDFLPMNQSSSQNDDSAEKEKTIEMERQADKRGLDFAARAGYAVDELLYPKPGKVDFLTLWTEQTNSKHSPSHPSPADRVINLKKQLHELKEQIRLFNFGVRLSHFGRYEDAKYFFEAFNAKYPGREVSNNLGYDYLQKARNAMIPERSEFYWMPALFDVETRATKVTRSLNRELGLQSPRLKDMVSKGSDDKANSHLEIAKEYFEDAIKADPSYVPARINLAITNLYLGRPRAAQQNLIDARELKSNDRIIHGLEIIALYEVNDAGLDLWPNAIEKLEELRNKDDEGFRVHTFNLARLYSVRSRNQQATKLWNSLNETKELPQSIRVAVCQEIKSLNGSKCKQYSQQTNPSKAWEWPIPVELLGTSMKNIRQIYLNCNNWKSTKYDDFNRRYGEIYHHSNGNELLEMNNAIQMIVIKDDRLARISDLNEYCGGPLHYRRLAVGKIISCKNWAVFLINDEIRELWGIF